MKKETIVIKGIEFATYDGERWFAKSIETRRQHGVYGTYTLEEWESIFKVTKKRQSAESSAKTA